MKLRKVLSLLLAAGIMATSLVTVANAEETKAKVIAEITEYDPENLGIFEGFYDTAEDLGIPEGGTAYLLEYKLANLNLGLKKTGTTEAHNRLGVLQLYYDVTNASNIVDVWNELITSEVELASVGLSNDSSYFSVIGSSTAGIWPTANITSQDYTEEEPTEAICNIIIVVADKDVPVTLTPKAVQQIGAAGSDDTYIKTVAYKGRNPVVADDVNYYPAGNNKGVEATLDVGTIVLGEAAPVDDGKGTEVKNGDAVIGTVWTKTFTDIATTNYKLIFTDAEGNVKPGEGDIDFGELANATVDIVLRSARAGVTLEVVGTPIAE